MKHTLLLDHARATKMAFAALAIAMATVLTTGALAQGAPAGPLAMALPDTTRGELLYSTHCITCHTDELHLRAKKLVTDQASLQRQVQRWQANAVLDWTDEDVLTVSRYLDARYYHLERP